MTAGAQEAVVFAAGRGSRLGAHTASTPKALVEVAGRPLIHHVLARLQLAGVGRVVVNIHHRAESMRAWHAARGAASPEVVLSHERDRARDTGGGLAQAASLLRCSGPLVLHNVDILCDVDLAAIVQTHIASQAEVSLLVARRESSRGLLFDSEGLLGRVNDTAGSRTPVRTAKGEVKRFAFQGIHVMSRAALEWFPPEPAVYSVLEPYLAAAAQGARILPVLMGDHCWLDVGRPADLARARALAGS